MRGLSRASSVVSALLIVLVAACGGGGGGGGTGGSGGGSEASAAASSAASTAVVSSLSFPLQAAFKANIAKSGTATYDISGDCTGTATISETAPVGDNFEGSPALSTTSNESDSITSCVPTAGIYPPVTFVDHTVFYFDSNYNPLGHSSSDYGKYLTGTTPLPSFVKVGDTGVIGAETTYSNNLKTNIEGTEVLSYVIEADTAFTVIANAIVKSYDSANHLTVIQQSRNRLDTTGTFTSLTVDIQAFDSAGTPSTHLVYTAK